MHGASSNNIERYITKTGFDEKVASIAGFFGAGIYFAENSSKANLYVPCPNCQGDAALSPIVCTCPKNQLYSMLVCRVLLGVPFICEKYDQAKFQGTAQRPVRQAPFKESSTERYDSIVVSGKVTGGDLVFYREFVVYNGFQVYPEYIVYYSREASGYDLPAVTGFNALVDYTLAVWSGDKG